MLDGGESCQLTTAALSSESARVSDQRTESVLAADDFERKSVAFRLFLLANRKIKLVSCVRSTFLFISARFDGRTVGVGGLSCAIAVCAVAFDDS